MQPLIIIGAPRSGTNALRDALCTLGPFVTWDCDELNPLWTTTNRSLGHDALGPEHANATAARRIRQAFERLAKGNPGKIIVEKTCANSLRLPFVREIFPDAYFVEIIRDGRDAAASAAERWNAPLDLAYSLKKLRFVPRADLGPVLLNQLVHRVPWGRTDADTPTSWGPVWPGFEALSSSGASLEQLCAAQWEECAGASTSYFASAEGSSVEHHRVSYEELVADPVAQLKQIADFVDVLDRVSTIPLSNNGLHARSIGRWTQTPLAEDSLALDTMRPLLRQLNYDS